MNCTTARMRPRRPGVARWKGHVIHYVVGGVILAALSLAGYGLAHPRAQGNMRRIVGTEQPVPYRRIPTLLARAQATDPLLRLPHARWFIRVRHGREQIVVVDHAAMQSGKTSIINTGRTQ
jgi:hypothetical protein